MPKKDQRQKRNIKNVIKDFQSFDSVMNSPPLKKGRVLIVDPSISPEVLADVFTLLQETDSNKPVTLCLFDMSKETASFLSSKAAEEESSPKKNISLELNDLSTETIHRLKRFLLWLNSQKISTKCDESATDLLFNTLNTQRDSQSNGPQQFDFFLPQKFSAPSESAPQDPLLNQLSLLSQRRQN